MVVCQVLVHPVYHTLQHVPHAYYITCIKALTQWAYPVHAPNTTAVPLT